MGKFPGVLRGAFLWGHTISSEPVWDGSFGKMRGYDVRGKLAETVVRAQYQTWLQADGASERTAQGPQEFTLSQNYPNPFNPSTSIRFEMPHAARVRLTVHTLLSQKVLTLLDEEKPAGAYEVRFNASLPSGMYFYWLEAGRFIAVKKMLIVR